MVSDTEAARLDFNKHVIISASKNDLEDVCLWKWALWGHYVMTSATFYPLILNRLAATLPACAIRSEYLEPRVPSLVPQRDYRIDLRCAPRRKITRQYGNGEQEPGRKSEGQRISRLHFE